MPRYICEPGAQPRVVASIAADQTAKGGGDGPYAKPLSPPVPYRGGFPPRLP